jgi:hypothetical protein
VRGRTEADILEEPEVLPESQHRGPRHRRPRRPPGREWAAVAGRASIAGARSSAFWGFVLAVATWPDTVGSFGARTGLDPSWQAALAMDAHSGIPFGTRAVFTYGPLGFLTTPYDLFYPGLTLLAVVFQLAMATSFFGLMVYFLRKVTSTPVAVVVALIAGIPALVLWNGSEALIAIGFAVAIELIRRDPDDPGGDLWWAGLGLLVGMTSLAKASVGVDTGVMALLAVLVAPRRHVYRSSLLAVGAFVVSFAVGWFGTGNGFGNLVAYFHGSLSVTGGYTGAIYTRTFELPDYEFWMVGVSAVVAGVLAWASHPAVTSPSRHWRSWLPLLRAVATSLGLTITLWVLFKAGIVKQGLRVYFFCLPLILASLLRRPLSRFRRPQVGTGPTIVVLAASMAAYLLTGPVPAQLVSPVTDGIHLAQEVHLLASPALSDRTVTENRQALQNAYAVPPSMLAAVSGQTVDIDPWEQQVAYAYPQMKWDSLPVFQNYSAYTTYLDQLDANYLASAQAPRYILRQPPESIDYRVPLYDAPSAQMTIECHYQEVLISPTWELLQRGPDRCGTPVPLATVSTGFGRHITVPRAPAGSMVVARFSLRLPLSWSLLNTFYRPPGINMFLNGSAMANRMIVETASDMHVVVPATDLGYGRPFGPGTVGSIVLSLQHHPPTSSGVVVHFYSVPFS